MNTTNIHKTTVLAIVMLLFLFLDLSAKNPDYPEDTSERKVWKNLCTRPKKHIDLEINNVRARLHTGGNLWLDGTYIVPKPAPGQQPVSALFNGGLWVIGSDRSRNIRLAASYYRTEGFDWFSGPLDINGASEKEVCDNWDRFFTVSGASVIEHAKRVIRATESGLEIDCDSIPDDILYWPGQKNPHWKKKYNFDLPDQPMASFWDHDNNGIYNPCNGDFPIIESRGCEPNNIYDASNMIPGEIVFWIFNDNGGEHTLSGPNTLQMEVQVHSFAYNTNDELNDMTFYHYKLINKAKEDLIDCYFGLFVDPDLGCYQDDRIGCDIERSLAYVYNEDEVDGVGATSQCYGVPTYGTNIPMVGIDFLRGPLGPKVYKRDSNGQIVYDKDGQPILLEPEPFSGNIDTLIELGMTSFTYSVGWAKDIFGNPLIDRDIACLNFFRGFWDDGTPLTYGGTGYNPGSTDTVRHVFSSPPNDNSPGAWSMCSIDTPFSGDVKMLQATGPMLLQPGASNELIFGVVFVPEVKHPCPDITHLLAANDIMQAFFDNCFIDFDDIVGPDAPDLTSVELDNELILLLSNEVTSNNYNEKFEEKDIFAPKDVDNTYKFEGYRIYQLANAQVKYEELSDVGKAREIVVTDVKNGIQEIYTWRPLENPVTEYGPVVWTPVKNVSGADSGVLKSFKVTEDQFATEDKQLINHKQYHFMVVAYAHNDSRPFNFKTGRGQKNAYLEGRKNVKSYTLVPRPILYENVQSSYGDEPEITRIQGEGNPGFFLEMDQSQYDDILSGNFDGKVRYIKGAGPFDVKIVNPLKIKDGNYRLEILGNFQANNQGTLCSFDKDAYWRLTDISSNEVLLDNRKLSEVKEYIINNFGFSVTIENFDEPGTIKNGSNGAVGARFEYARPNEDLWFNAIRDGGIYQNGVPGTRFYDFIRGDKNDENGSLSKMGNGFFVPILSTRYEDDEEIPFYLSPGPKEVMRFATSNNINSLRYSDLNNVDIVFTSDKSKWSKCIVVETASTEFIESGGSTINSARNFNLRNSPSIDKNGQILNDRTVGFSYFPGYAIDVETGKRLNIFFGENSFFSGENAKVLQGKKPIGGDLIFNPSSEAVIEDFVVRNPNTGAIEGVTDLRALVQGGQHYIYVTRMEYDGCAAFYDRLKYSVTGTQPNLNNKYKVLSGITWTAVPLPTYMTSLEEGLIPNDLTVKLRVNNAYSMSKRFTPDMEKACLTDMDLPVYEFGFKNAESKKLTTREEFAGALENVNVVPNPYYAYTSYWMSQHTNVIKITNLPAKAVVTIYGIDGSFIRQYKRNESELVLPGNSRPTSTSQVYPDLEWDMKNFAGKSLSSGVYLIHILAPEYGEERTIKWFGVNRKGG